MASLIIINNYPPIVVQNQIISTKKAELTASATMLAVALENSPGLTLSSVRSSVGLLNVAHDKRLIVTNASAKVVYDSVSRASLYGNFVIFPQILTALNGKDVFLCTYDENAFISRVATPISKDGQVIGAVFIYDLDTEDANFLSQTRTDILGISVVVFIIFSIFIATLMRGFSHRLGALLSGVEKVGQGDLDFKINLLGNDEFCEIASEFNALTSKLQSDELTRQRFVSDASHELKTPLASIKLLSDSIIQTDNISHADVKEFLTDINDEIDRLTGITESLLQLSALDALPNIKLDWCDIHLIAQKCAKFLKANASEMGVEIIISVPKNTLVWASESGLYHVLFNLMQNAIKYNRPGGQVHISASSAEKDVLIKVSDTGIGILQSEIERVFDRFYRVDRARSRATGGSGLGLSIVSRWVQNMGGYIEVDSRIDVGSEFRVYLKSSDGGAQCEEIL